MLGRRIGHPVSTSDTQRVVEFSVYIIFALDEGPDGSHRIL